MKKNKKISPSLKFPFTFLRQGFAYVILAVVFVLCLFVLLYRYVNQVTHHQEFSYQSSAPAPAPETVPAPAPEAVPAPAPEAVPAPAPETVPAPPPPREISLLQNEVAAQNNRLTQIETHIHQWQFIQEHFHRILAMELLREVLEGRFPLSIFILYLQKTPESWAPPILNSVSSITECKTYAQIQALFALPPQSHSLWQWIKNNLKSFVRIRKLDTEGQSQEDYLDAIHRALQEHNIGKALEVFAKLSPEEQAQFALWKQEAQYRLALEQIEQKLLLELAGVN